MAIRAREAVVAALVSLLAAAGPASAQQCPTVPAPHLPEVPKPLNLQTIKTALVGYHEDNYTADIAAVYALAQAYVERRAGEVENPAVVLDIDETTLSNWPNLKADDFGFVAEGSCDDLPNGPCGFNAWVLRAEAEAFAPAVKFFNAAKAKGAAIVFITGRRNALREVTLWNLDRAGYEGYATLILRPDHDDFKSVREFKTKARAKLAVERNYTIIASIGDQQSDIEQEPGIADGQPECGFKLPNPFYFIP